MPAASTATSVTSARPIISADAVEAVRCGLRRAFSRASDSGDAAELRRGPAERGGERPDEPLREQRDAEEDHQRAEAHPDEQRRRARGPARRAPRTRAAKPSSVRRIEPGTRRNAKRDCGSVAPSRTAAIGGTRVARNAGRRLATHRDEDSRSERDHDGGRRAGSSPLFGSVKPTASKSANSALREPDADGEPDQRREHADDERLDQDRRQDLPAGRADRPQGRELPRPLGDRDRERVGDHEAADEEGDPAESEQEAAQERDEAVRLRGVVLEPAAPPSSPGRSAGVRLELANELLVGHARLRRDGDLVEPAALVEQLLRGREVEARESVAPPIVETEPKRTRPEIRKPLCGAFRLNADRLAEPEVLLVRRRLVDHDLARRRPGALDERERVEGRGAARC